MKQMTKVLFATLLGGALLTTANVDSASAADKKDLQIIAKALSFLEGGPSGDVDVAIVYDPSNGASKAEADAVNAVLGGGFKSGKITLNGKLVPVAQAGGHTGAVAYLAEGAEAAFGPLSGKGVVTVATTDGCLNANACVLTVDSAPKVAIKVSTAAAAATGASFQSAFRMMVQEF